MANQIKTKYIGNDQVSSEKVLLSNNTAIRAKNSSNSTVDLLKIDGTNKVIAYRSTGAEEIAYMSDVNAGGTGLTDHLNDTTDAHDASAISFSATGNISSTDVQAAIAELDNEKLALAGGTMSGSLNMNTNTITGLPTPTANGQPLIYNQLGAASGIAPLNASSKIDSTYLPSYVDDVEEYANTAAFPGTGEAAKIYVALDTNKTYRWSGTVYVEISPSEVNSVNGQTGVVSLNTSHISESGNLYFTNQRAKDAAVANSITNGVTDVAPSQDAVYDALALKFDSSSFNSSFDTQFATKTTSNLTEGSNLYFTNQRAKDAAVSDTAYGSGWNGVTDVAPSKNAVYDEIELAKSRLTTIEGVSAEVYKKTLNGTDISNEYIDLPYLATQTNDFHVFADRLALHQGAAEDYTLSTSGGITRITFLNDMLSTGNQALASGDTIYVRYKRNT